MAGEIGDTFYVIISGRVRVLVNGVGEVAQLAAGDHFGELALLHTQTRNATIETVEQCEFVYLQRDDFQVCYETYIDGWCTLTCEQLIVRETQEKQLYQTVCPLFVPLPLTTAILTDPWCRWIFCSVCLCFSHGQRRGSFGWQQFVFMKSLGKARLVAACSAFITGVLVP